MLQLSSNPNLRLNHRAPLALLLWLALWLGAQWLDTQHWHPVGGLDHGACTLCQLGHSSAAVQTQPISLPPVWRAVAGVLGIVLLIILPAYHRPPCRAPPQS